MIVSPAYLSHQSAQFMHQLGLPCLTVQLRAVCCLQAVHCAQGLIPACRDARRKADRLSSESDAARQRVLGHGRTAHFSDLSSKFKRETPERLQEKAREDLVRTEARRQPARLLLDAPQPSLSTTW